MATTKYAKYTSTKNTPQSIPIPGRNMVLNAAGGYVFPVSIWDRLHRFLTLGSECGTYYVGESKATLENVQAVIECIHENGVEVVSLTRELSISYRTPKVSPVLYVLALCIAKGDLATRQAAYQVLPEVARTASHLFELVENINQMRSWGRGLRRAIGHWYNDKMGNALQYQIVKYRNRSGWTHKDVLRCAHIKPCDEEHAEIFKYIIDGVICRGMIAAYELVSKLTNPEEVAAFLRGYTPGLPWEALDTSVLGSTAVWDVLLSSIGETALLRNLGRLSSIGYLTDENYGKVLELLTAEKMKRGRVHPLAVLIAMKTYAQGHGERGSLIWKPVSKIVDRLGELFVESMPNVMMTDKRVLVGYDISGSMEGNVVVGVPNLFALEAAAALGLMFQYSGDSITNVVFHTDAGNFAEMKKGARLADVVHVIQYNYNHGGTDCAQPVLFAMKNKIPVDAFIILTDDESWSGSVHPIQAVEDYRKRMGIPAKLISVSLASNGYTIVPPCENDRLSLHVSGLDTASYDVIVNFINE